MDKETLEVVARHFHENLEVTRKARGNDRMSVNEAAKELGISAAVLMQGMRSGTINIGYALSPKQNKTTKWKYLIYRDKVDEFLGRNKHEANT